MISSLDGAFRKVCRGRPGLFIGVGRRVAEVMQTAVNVGVFLRIDVLDRVEHRPGLLRRRGIVQIDQRLAVDLARQDREILADLERVDRPCGLRLASSMCSAFT